MAASLVIFFHHMGGTGRIKKVSVLLLIYVSNRFVRYLAQAASGDIGADVVVRLVFYKVVSSSVYRLPVPLPMHQKSFLLTSPPATWIPKRVP